MLRWISESPWRLRRLCRGYAALCVVVHGVGVLLVPVLFPMVFPLLWMMARLGRMDGLLTRAIETQPIHRACSTCFGYGWVVVDRTIDWPYGEQVECPGCDGVAYLPAAR